MKLKFQKGVTLIELILVIAIISIITVFAVFSGTTLGEQVRFASAYRNVEGILSEARNRALSGESYVDEDFYDDDDSNTDLILPNGYIVNFNTDGEGIIKVSLYADRFLNESIAGQLDTDADTLIKTITLPDDIEFDLTAQDKFGGAETISDPNDFSVLYKTPDAAFELIDYNPTILQIEIKQVNDSGELKRNKYLFLHYLYGIPEVLSDPFI
jgi:prepilin-type N-terminal cleavage/methylation domain-containing protein